MRQLRPLLTAFLGAALASSCGAAPSERPISAATEAPGSTQVAGCTRDRDEGNPLLAGWLEGQLVATFRHGPCVFDSTSGRWLGLGPRMSGRFTTDGTSLASSAQPGRLTIQTPGTQPVEVALPPWATDWAAWGSPLLALPGGGYVFGLVPELATISVRGTLSETPIPAGYLVIAPTSDRDVFVLRRDDRADPQRMTGPYPATTWRLGDASPSALPMLVERVQAADAPNLAWIRDDGGGWWRLGQSRVAAIGFRPPAPWDGEPDPTGRYAIEQTDRSQGCEHDSPPSCVVRLVDRSTAGVVAQAESGSNSAFFWAKGAVAFTPTTADPVGQPTASGVVVLSSAGASEIPLPTSR